MNLSIRIINTTAKSLMLKNKSNVVPFTKVQKQTEVDYGPWCCNSGDLWVGRAGGLERHRVVGWTEEKLFLLGRVSNTRNFHFVIFIKNT